MKSLKHGVQQQLNKKQLSNKQLSHLLALQRTSIKEAAVPYFSQYTMATLASALLLSFVFGFFYFTEARYGSIQTLEQQIAEEVAGNHLKLKPLELSSNSLLEISSFFKQLDFLPVNPALVPFTKKTLLGGRYCSIQGVTALQLRVVNNESNKIQSLFETAYDKKVFKDFPDRGEGRSNALTVYVKGMKVDMWIEKDILFALIE